jgi:hypothetical protein
LSEALGDELLKMLHEFRAATWPDDAEYKVATRWSSVKKANKKLIREKFLEYPAGVIKWPASWQMSKWSKGKKPELPKLQCRNVLELISHQFMNPELIFGWGKHIELKAYKNVTSNGEQAYGSIMSSPWAYETESELHQTNPNATLMPIILNEDGVALGKTNRQISTALSTIGNFDNTLQQQDISINCLNYLAKLSIPDEIQTHLVEKAGFNKTNAALAVTYFKKKLERLFWNLVLVPIRQAHEIGGMLCIYSIIY